MNPFNHNFRRPDPAKGEKPSNLETQYLEEILQGVEDITATMVTMQTRLDTIEQKLEEVKARLTRLETLIIAGRGEGEQEERT